MKFSIYTVTLSLLFLAVSCADKEEVKEEVLRTVKYEEVGTSDDQQIRTFSGVAKAKDEISLSFRSGGIITQANVDAGQTVKKGALLARLDNIEADLAYEKSVSSLSAAKSAMSTMKNELERVKSLYETDGVSLSEYQSAKDQYENSLAQFESAQRNRSIQQTQVEYGFIYAPQDGVIARKEGEVNENISPGHVFAILNAGEGMNIEVGIPENIINKVKVGMAAEINLSSLSTAFKGEVMEVAPIPDENSATYTVKVLVKEPGDNIKSGMAANVTFNLNPDPSAKKELVVPIKAVGEDSNGNFVFIVETENNETGIIKKRTLEIGKLQPEGFRVISGLKAGEKIAVAGLQTLLEDQKVRLQQ